MPPPQAIRALSFFSLQEGCSFKSLLTSLKPHDCSQSSRQLNSKAQAHYLPTPQPPFSCFLKLVLWGGKEELNCTQAAYGRVAGSALQVALPLPFRTCPDQVPGLYQQHHVSLLEVLSAVGAQQPSGVAQHPQNTSMQQVVGHVCIHSSQRVIKEIEGFLLDRMNTAGTMAQVL